MSGELPSVLYGDGITKWGQVQFGGYNHNLWAQDGELWDMQNMSSDYYPLLSPRKPRYLLRTLANPNGFYAHDGIYWVDGTKFYANGTEAGTVENSRKTFSSLGNIILILPDKKFYNIVTREFGSVETSRNGGVTITDGTYAGEAAEANTIYAENADWANLFRPGDAVTISGCTTHPENNKTAIIREIDGDYMRFYENAFVIDEGGDTETATIARTMPDMDFVCENENRLWGCKGDTIFASKLGDLFNWNVFDGLSTDSYAVDVGSAGDFTACCSYLGYPIFFKENNIYKVYGSKPSNFEAMGSASLGVQEGSSRSLAIAGEVLYYLSRVGIVAYSGGIPANVSAPFGDVRYHSAVAGSDGVKYYVSMQGAGGTWHMFVYDTEKRVWHREDALHAADFGWNDDLYFLAADGKLWLNGNARTIPAGAETELNMESYAEFGDFTEQSPNKKGVGKFQLRIELETGATVQVKIQFDSSGTWETIYSMTATAKKSFYIPIIPKRCDHMRLRINGIGQWRLYSLVREGYIGSELR